MSRRPALFTEADLKRAIKVAEDKGWHVRVNKDGSFEFLPGAEPKKTVDVVREIRM